MSNIRGVIDIDSAGNENFNGVFGESVAEHRLDAVTVQFQYDYYDEQFDVNPEVVTGDGATSCANGLAIVSSATTGTAYRASRDSIRYRPAHTGYAYFTASFSGTGVGIAGSTDLVDGFALKVSNGSLSFGYYRNGVEKGSNGTSGFDTTLNGGFDLSTLDLTKVNIFMITFGYLGVANPTLWVKKDRWSVLHTCITEGVLDTTHVSSPVFPISIYAENNMSVASGSWCGGTIGIDSGLGGRGFSFPNTPIASGAGPEQGEVTLVSTNVTTLALFRSKATYQGKTNHVKAQLTGYGFEVDVPAGNVIGTVVFQIIGQPTVVGTPTYTDVNANSSIMEYDHTAGTGSSITTTGGFVLVSKSIDYVGSNKGGSTTSATLDAESLGAFAYSGDVFAIVAKDLNGNGVTTRLTLNWEELF